MPREIPNPTSMISRREGCFPEIHSVMDWPTTSSMVKYEMSS